MEEYALWAISDPTLDQSGGWVGIPKPTTVTYAQIVLFRWHTNEVAVLPTHLRSSG